METLWNWEKKKNKKECTRIYFLNKQAPKQTNNTIQKKKLLPKEQNKDLEFKWEQEYFMSPSFKVLKWKPQNSLDSHAEH